MKCLFTKKSFPIYFLFLNLILAFSPAKAEDWDLFQFGQKSFYGTPDYYQDYLGIYLLMYDSTGISGNENQIYFNRAVSYNNQLACYDSLFGYSYLTTVSSEGIIQDGMVYRYAYNEDSLLFFASATLNQTWLIDPDGSGPLDFYTTQITCDSIYLGDLFGLQDSMKRFRLQGYYFGDSTSSFDDKFITLSKHYGVVEYLNFGSILNGSATQWKLIGFELSGQPYGFSIPAFEAYFHYHAGDIYKWSATYDPENFTDPGYWETWRDSITNVYQDNDSTVITFNREQISYFATDTPNYYLENQVTAYRKRDLQYLIDKTSGIVGLANVPFADLWIDSSFITWDATLLFDPVTNYTESSAFTWAPLVDTNDCEIYNTVDIGYSNLLSTNTGLSGFGKYYGGWYSASLIGWSSITDTSGDYFPLSSKEPSLKAGLEIYPNPSASGIFEVKFPMQNRNETIMVTDMMGRIVKTEKINSEVFILDLSDQPQGLYFLSETSSHSYLFAKLIRE